MSLLKRVLIGVGILVLILGAGVLYVLSSFDSVRIKNEIELLVADKTGRKLRIDDKIGLSFYPDLAVALGGLHLSERGQADQEFATVERARVSVKLMPLLSQRVEAQQVELVGLKVRIVVGKDGRRNIDDLVASPASAKPGAEPAAHAATPRFNIAGIRIERARLDYVDESSKQRYELSEFALTTGLLANAAASDFKTSGKLSGSGMTLGFNAIGAYRYDLDAGNFAAEKLAIGLRGTVPGIKDLDLALQAGTISFGTKSEIQVDKLALKTKGQHGTESFDASLELPKLHLSASGASGETLKLDARLVGKDGPLSFRVQAAGIQGGADALQIGKLVLGVDGKRGDTTIKGEVTTALKAGMAGKTLDAARIAGEIEVASPAMPMKSARLGLSGNLRANWAKPSAAGDMVVKFDETTIQTKVDLARVEPLALGFDLAIDRLNVDRYFPPAPKSAELPSAQGGKSAPVADPVIDLKVLQGPDVRGSIRVGALQASNVKIANFRTDLRLQGGRLDLNGLAANLYDGRMSGSVSVDSRGNRLALKQSLEGVNINPLLRDVAAKDIVEGRGNVVLDVATGGGTVGAMKRALSGSAAVALKDGAIKGINLGKSFREFKAKVSSRQDASQKASHTEKTDFSEMTVSFKIAGGVAHSEDLSVKSPFLRLGGAGDVNIGESSINYLAKASVVNTSGGQEGKDLEHLKGMTIPVRLTGPFDNLAYKIEFGALVQDAVKAKVQEKVQQKVDAKLGDKLKGLLKK